MDRRRRLGVLAGSIAAIGAGLSGLLGRHEHGAGHNPYALLIGISVGVSVGLLIVMAVKLRGAGSNSGSC